MKIKTIDGVEVDTDKLPDTNAMAIEKLTELGNLLKDYDLSFFILVDLPDKKAYANKYITKERAGSFIYNMHGALMALTYGKVGLAIHDTDQPPPLED